MNVCRSRTSFAFLAGVVPHALLLALAAWVTSPVTQTSAAEPEFKPLFDGRSLRGWQTPDPTWWSVEDGAITGRITRDRPCGTNQYLVWSGGALADFELKLKSRLRGEGGINNGFQFRSLVLPDGDVAGYQVDNNLQTDWLVRLYDEFGRHTLAWRGRSSVFEDQGRVTSSPLPEAAGPAWFALEAWHEYHLVCRGPHLSLHVDGRLVAEVDDRDPRRADPVGVLALQLHSGPPTVVQFRDILLRPLTPTPAVPAPAPPWYGARGLPQPLAAWDLGTGGHDPHRPLRYVGSLDDVEFNVRATGPGHRTSARVAILRGGYFDAGHPFLAWTSGATLALRVQDPSGRWNGTLLTQGTPGRGDHVSLSAHEGQLHLILETAAGRAELTCRIPPEEATSWQRLVVRLDASGTSLFRQGERVAHDSQPLGALATPSGTLHLGATLEGTKPVHRFHGELEAVAFWATALPDDQLAELK
ncbi:MAG: DUF1080 domain-containing protein [Verrucomicrobiales bacterium]|nr:DUF1080 domain-containing protein [Verrucomicrobiales bacterium]